MKIAPPARPWPRLMAAPLLGALLGTAWAEPPQPPGLSCRVLQQQVQDGMTLEVAFGNASEQPLSLAPGPHLVWYRDAAAEDPLERTVRAARLQNGPLVLAAGESRTVLFAFAPTLVDELRCNGVAPAAAALYFYQFNRRPQLRCLLLGYRLDAIEPRPGCPPVPLRP